MKLKLKTKDIVICAGCLVIVLCAVTATGVGLYNYTKPSLTDKIVITSAIDTTGFDTSEPHGSYVMSEEEFEEFKAEEDTMISFETYEEYVTNASASFVDSSSSFVQEAGTITATDANAKLYAYCDQYFLCYYGDKRVSPILPLAIANVETGGRADHDKTWSSLFPSKIVDVSLIDTFDVTTVLSDPTIFKALTSDYSTRDRGALQMSPTYGTGNTVINKKMSGTEKEKLKSVDTSKYSSWCSGASSCAGDRFYIPDMLLRMQAAMNYNVQQVVSNDYTPDDMYHLLAMLSVGHNSGSGVFSSSNPTKKVGNWYGAGKCYEWCRICSDAPMLDIMRDYSNQTNSITIDTTVAEKMLNKVHPGVQYNSYTSSKTNAYYPIKFLYTYLMLSKLYTQ